MSRDVQIAPAPELPEFARGWINLADTALGAEPCARTDEFFAEARRMLDPAQPAFYPERYDEHGKWMDGWETRRRRNGGHDWCVVRLGLPGVVRAVDFDTSFFTGNFPPAVQLEGCYSPEREPDDGAAWRPLTPSLSLEGNSHRFVRIDDDQAVTHVRLHLYPDGGVARLRVYGEVWCDWAGRDPNQVYNLVALANGGREVACSDAHFGRPAFMLREGRGVNMGDGWETRRRREPGNDWCVLQLGHPGVIEQVEVDTAHFKGNYPDRLSIQAARVTWGTDQSIVTQSMFWDTLLPEQKLEADSIHSCQVHEPGFGPVTHVRVNIIPDGGVSRIRLWGRPSRQDG